MSSSESSEAATWNENTPISLSDLNRTVTLSNGVRMKLGVSTDIPFVNELINCTPHNISIINDDHVITIEAKMNVLRLKSQERSRIRTMPGYYEIEEDVVFSNQDDSPITEQEEQPPIAEQEEQPPIAEQDNEPPQKRTKRQFTSVNIFEPQIFCGFMDDQLPRISRSKCGGILVSMVVGQYLESIDIGLNQIVDAAATDLDLYDEPPTSRRRVPVYGPDVSPSACVRDASGRIIGCTNLVRYNAFY